MGVVVEKKVNAGVSEALAQMGVPIGPVRDDRAANCSASVFFNVQKNNRSSDLQIKDAVAPAFTKLIGHGKVKLVYLGYRSIPLPKGIPNVSFAFSKINDVVYIISKKRFNDELKDELRIGRKIKNKVYVANLEKFFISLHQSFAKAKILAKELCQIFPTHEAFATAYHGEDQNLRDFFLRHSLGKIDGGSSAAKRLFDSCLHLSLDLVYSPTILIHGKHPVLAKKAEGDLEAMIRKRKYPLSDTAPLILQIMKGFRDLHAGGYIHGDLKLENILVYNFNGKSVVKIADWGKCKKMAPDELGFHTGNHRQMPPERLSSQKGEVFGVGMLAVRILEEEFLPGTHDMLLVPDPVDLEKEKILREENDPNKSRKGIERFLSISKNCPEIDANWGDTASHIGGSLKSLIAKSHPNIDPIVERYLGALQERLEMQYGKKKAQTIVELIGLLKNMLKSNRHERISMEEAVPRMEAILASLI